MCWELERTKFYTENKGRQNWPNSILLWDLFCVWAVCQASVLGLTLATVMVALQCREFHHAKFFWKKMNWWHLMTSPIFWLLGQPSTTFWQPRWPWVITFWWPWQAEVKIFDKPDDLGNSLVMAMVKIWLLPCSYFHDDTDNPSDATDELWWCLMRYHVLMRRINREW